ncbi:MAG: hypothetical protein QG625_3726 [Cyanobacteriota bacterium erpe_2018_sw_39hr_WHONDRS-SW48-000098_B_bin.30]|jgi:hypothetical protein|nr:hypothetical protein [Cyanobacteriota bacterium erpe_2018_sw_39hr_WHONDRS-SW48-000098_B_bin.30]
MKIFRLLLLSSAAFVVVALIVTQSVKAQAADESAAARAYVKEFYAWYLPPVGKRKDNEPNLYTAVANKRFCFSPALSKALKEDEQAAAKNPGEIVGIDFDPFLNAQDVSDSYQPAKVVKKGDVYRVDVFAVNGGKKNARPEVIAEVKKINGRWTFTNFLYGKSSDPRDEDLLSCLKALKADRDKYDQENKNKKH